MTAGELSSLIRGAAHYPAMAYPGDEMQFMCQAFLDVMPNAIFEWGTYNGSSARVFWECARILGHPCAIHTTELPVELTKLDGAHPGETPGEHIRDTEVHQHRGDGVIESLVQWARITPARSIFFIDGDHSVEAVYREIMLVHRMVPRAIILVHDANHGPGYAARLWVEKQGTHTYTETTSRVGMARLDPL